MTNILISTALYANNDWMETWRPAKVKKTCLKKTCLKTCSAGSAKQQSHSLSFCLFAFWSFNIQDKMDVF